MTRVKVYTAPPETSETPTRRSLAKRTQVDDDVSETLTTTPSSSWEAFNFLNLPPEIRLEIYCLLLTSPDPLLFLPPKSWDDLKANHIAHLPDSFPSFTTSLLCVSRQLQSEAMPVLYGRNSFHFHTGSKPLWWGNARSEGAGPSPFNSSLALPRTVIPYLNNVVFTVLSQRKAEYNGHLADDATDFAKIKGWIRDFCRLMKTGRTTKEIRSIRIELMRDVKIRVNDGPFYLQTSWSYDKTICLEKDERVLDGFKLLRNVKEVVVDGCVTKGYKRELVKAMTTEERRPKGAVSVRQSRYSLRSSQAK